jgi:hypothetical protein
MGENTFLAGKQQYHSLHSKKETSDLKISNPRGADLRLERQDAPQHSEGRYTSLRDADLKT